MSASTIPEGYQAVIVSTAKLELLMDFLVQLTEGPAEAVALLHRTLAAIPASDGTHRSAKQLAEELAFGLIASGVRDT